jgi:cytochrome c biogenesis protein CcmG/thiol:disulfide interchange protein DsbE
LKWALGVGPHLPLLAAMTPKRLLIGAGSGALLALLAVGLVQLAGASRTPALASKLTPAQMRALLADSPAPLAALHAHAGELLPGGLGAVRARLAGLRRRPVVINKWASWCVPCRSEFGALQGASVAQGRKVAFLGIDSGEASRAEALAFLHSHPVAYPSYYDQSGDAGVAITDSAFTPVTVFYDPGGGEFIHQGPYTSQAKLELDIRRYALDGRA